MPIAGPSTHNYTLLVVFELVLMGRSPNTVVRWDPEVPAHLNRRQELSKEGVHNGGSEWPRESAGETMRNKIVVRLIVFSVGCLAGFIPQYLKSHQLQTEVSALTASSTHAGLLTAVSASRYSHADVSGSGKGITALLEIMPAVSLIRLSALRAIHRMRPYAICSERFWPCAIRSRQIWQKGMPPSFPKCRPLFRKWSDIQNSSIGVILFVQSILLALDVTCPGSRRSALG